MTLIGLIVFLCVIGIVLYLISMAPMDGFIKRIVQCLVLLVAVVYLLEALGLMSVGPVLRFR